MPEPIGGVQPFAELARNGPTVVYKGYQRAHDRFVLLKAVRAEAGGDGQLGERLADEAELAAQVRHPNVVAVLETGNDGLTAYLITEFVEGLDLRDLLARGPLPVPLAVYVVREAAEGLRAVHASGILHRDLKPANVLVSERGDVKLADFGLASLAPEGGDEMRGTLAYLAPEIVRGEPPTVASDLFALGAVLAEALSGRAAFARADAGATLDAVLHHDPIAGLAADPRVPTALTVLVAKLLAKDPAQRIAGATHLVAKLEAYEDQQGRASARDLAAFVEDPASFVLAAPVPVGDHQVAKSLEPMPAGRPPARSDGTRLRWAPWLLAAAGAVLLALGYGLVRPGSQSGPDPVPERTVASAPGPAEESAPLRSPDVSLSQGTEDDSKGGGGSGQSQPGASPAPSQAEPSAPDVSPGSDRPVEQEEVVLAVPEDTAGPVPAEGAEPGERTERGERTGSEEGTEPSPTTAPARGSLTIAAEPWAQIRIDGEVVGTTPLEPLTLDAGVHTVTFENPEFPPHSVQVVVEQSETVHTVVSLWDLVGRVRLAVSPWARVEVNGTYWDTVPPQDRPLILPPGTHRLRFEHPVLGAQEATLSLAAGEERAVRITLAE